MRRPSQRRADLRDYHVWAGLEVCCRETKYLMSRTDQKVLAAIVPNEAIAMISAVEFDDQPAGGIVEICSAQESAV